VRPIDDDRTLVGGESDARAEPLDRDDQTVLQPRQFGDSVTQPGGISFGDELEPPRAEVTRLMDTNAMARPPYGEDPRAQPQGYAAGPPPAAWHGPAPGHFPPPAPSSDRVLLPPAAKPGVTPSDDGAPLPGWVLPYVIAALALALGGAFVLWIQSRVLGHF
jgi:hypothetical protein